VSAALARDARVDDPGFGPGEHARAVVNILEDFAAEKARLQDTQRAVLNILDDFGSEKERLEQTKKAVLNILSDFGSEKDRLERMQRAVLNILEDLAFEKVRLEQTQNEVRASLREKEVLLKEIHHRVKNNLQVISSLLNLQARYLPDPAAREIFLSCQDRVQSIALVHEKLYQSADLSHIDFGEYVIALVDNLFHAYNARERGVSSRIDVGRGRLTVELAIPCGLIVNELVTNSLKHAFPSGPGTIFVFLRERAGGTLELTVGDDGVGMPGGLATRRDQTLGLDLVFTFAEQIEAKTTIDGSDGTSFRFSFPESL